MQRCAASGTRLSSLPDHRFTTSGPSLCTGKQIRSICAHAAGAEPGRGGWTRWVAEHAPAHGLSRIPHDSVRQGMLDRNVRRGMLGAAKLARRTRRKRHEHASAHANTVAPASSRAEPHPCAGACSTGPEGRFFSPARPPSMPLRTALPSMPPCTEPAINQVKPCAGACSGQAGGRPRQTRATSSPWSESQARRPQGTPGRRRPRQQGAPRNRR